MLFGFFLRVSSPDPPQPYRGFENPLGHGSGPSGIFKSPLGFGDLGQNPLDKIRILYINFPQHWGNFGNFPRAFTEIPDKICNFS